MIRSYPDIYTINIKKKLNQKKAVPQTEAGNSSMRNRQLLNEEQAVPRSGTGSSSDRNRQLLSETSYVC